MRARQPGHADTGRPPGLHGHAPRQRRGLPLPNVGRHAYRFRILNASDDRLNLQLYYAKTADANHRGTPSEVALSRRRVTTGARRTPTVVTDAGPDPKPGRSELVQIGNEGGFLPTPSSRTRRSAMSTSDADHRASNVRHARPAARLLPSAPT